MNLTEEQEYDRIINNGLKNFMFNISIFLKNIDRYKYKKNNISDMSLDEKGEWVLYEDLMDIIDVIFLSICENEKEKKKGKKWKR
jgi:hypothetical protein